VILLTVVCLLLAESTSFLSRGLFKSNFDGSGVCLTEVGQEIDQNSLEMKGLLVSSVSCVEAFVLVGVPADCYGLVSQVLSVSRWHLRGPPLG